MKEKASIYSNVQNILDRIDNYALTPEQYLDRNFGHGSWTYDPCSAMWIVIDDQHVGPGRGYVALDRDLRRREFVVQVN